MPEVRPGAVRRRRREQELIEEGGRILREFLDYHMNRPSPIRQIGEFLPLEDGEDKEPKDDEHDSK